MLNCVERIAELVDKSVELCGKKAVKCVDKSVEICGQVLGGLEH